MQAKALALFFVMQFHTAYLLIGWINFTLITRSIGQIHLLLFLFLRSLGILAFSFFLFSRKSNILSKFRRLWENVSTFLLINKNTTGLNIDCWWERFKLSKVTFFKLCYYSIQFADYFSFTRLRCSHLELSKSSKTRLPRSETKICLWLLQLQQVSCKLLEPKLSKNRRL